MNKKDAEIYYDIKNKNKTMKEKKLDITYLVYKDFLGAWYCKTADNTSNLAERVALKRLASVYLDTYYENKKKSITLDFIKEVK